MGSYFCYKISPAMTMCLFLSLLFLASFAVADVTADLPTDKTSEVPEPTVSGEGASEDLMNESQLSEEEPNELDESESEEPTYDSELSEEEPEDSDEPTNDEAIAPEEDHHFWHCHRYTGGTCAWFGCDHWRHAHCHHGHCVCGWGKCAWHGRCLWQSEMTAEEDEIVA